MAKNMGYEREKEFRKKLEEDGLSKSEIDKEVKETIGKMKGLINEATALFVIMKKRGLIDDEEEKQISEQPLTGIGTINEDGIFTIEGRIMEIEEIKKINFKDGTDGSLLKIVVSDETGAIKVNFWREDADTQDDKLSSGDSIKISKIGIGKNSFSGLFEGNFNRNSKIEDIDKKFKKTHEISETTKGNVDFTGDYIKVKDVVSDEMYLELEGEVEKLGRIFVYEACSKCIKAVRNCTCNEDGGPEKTEYRLIVNILFKDDTGKIRITFFGEEASEIIDREPIDMKIKINSGEEYYNGINESLKGKKIAIKGKSQWSDYNNCYEISGNKYKFIEE